MLVGASIVSFLTFTSTPSDAATIEYTFDTEVRSVQLYAAPGCSFDPGPYECDAGEHRGPNVGDTGTGWATLDTEASIYDNGFACNVMGLVCSSYGGSHHYEWTEAGDMNLASYVMAEGMAISGGGGSYHRTSDMATQGIPDYDIRIDFSNVKIVGLDPAPEVAPVPLPASAPLLALGLAGLVAWRRKSGGVV